MHVTQRGVNRVAIFVDDADRGHFRALLRRAIVRYGVALHAYVLMSNHVHLLLTAHAPGAAAAMMRQLGTCYAQAFNRRHDRTGALWQGRFKSCLVDSDAYCLAVHRYIELNPVRAGMVDRPEAYAWSSVHGNLQRRIDPLLTTHASLDSIARDPGARAARYREFLRSATEPQQLDQIRRHTNQERALGTPAFQTFVESAVGRPARLRPAGRPKKGDGGN